MSHCWRLIVGWTRRKLVKNSKAQCQGYTYFPSARTWNMYDNKKPQLGILRVGTKNVLNNTSREVLDKTLKVKTYIQEKLPNFKITISTPIIRYDHGKTPLTILQ